MSEQGRHDRLRRRLQRARTLMGERGRREQTPGEPAEEPAVEESHEEDATADLGAGEELGSASEETGWGERPALGDLVEPRRRDRLRPRLPKRPRMPQRRRPRLPRRLRLHRPSGRAGSTLTGAGGILRGVGSGVGRVLRGAGSHAGRGLSRGGRTLDAVGHRLALTWARTSLLARRRIAAALALAVLAALFAFVLVPNAPCAFPGGERCPPGDDAITLVPDDALVYLHANVEAEDPQFQAVEELARELPQLALDLASAVPILGEVVVDFGEGVDPWAADELAVAVFSEGLGVSQVALIEVEDTEGALAYAEGLVADDATEATLNGITITSDRRGDAFAIVEGYLAVGDRAAVGGIVRVGAGELEPLSDVEGPSELLDDLPDRRVASGYVSGVGLDLAERSGALGAFDTFLDSSASRGAAATISVEEGEIGVEVASDLDPESVEEDPGVLSTLPAFDPELPERVGSDALALVTIGDAQESIGRLLSQATTEAPDLLRGLRRFARRLQGGSGSDLEERLLGVLGSETALTVEPPTTEAPDSDGEGTPGIDAAPQAPYLGLFAREVDEEAAKETLAGLQKEVADAVDTSRGQAATFQTEEIDGVEAQVLRISRAVELTYGFVDGTLVAGSSPVAIERFTGDQGSLADDDDFEAAVAGLPEQLGMLVFFDLEGLIELGEAAGLATDPAFALRAPELRRLRDAVLAVTSSEQELRTRLRLTLGEASGLPEPEVETPPPPLP